MTYPNETIQTPSKPKVAIIVLNWNGLNDTLECVESLKRSTYTNYEIIVTDNGSTDKSLEILKQRHSDLKYIDNKANLGYAEGNNRAIQYALSKGFDHLFILNNDTTISSNCIEELANAAKYLPTGSVLGCQVRYYDRPDIIWDFGSYWDEKKLKLKEIGRNQSPEEWSRIEPVDKIIGCAMYIPAETIRKVGFFDERFFLNYEETDWCFRAKHAGINIYSIPKALVFHKISASFTSTVQGAYYLSRNRLLWIEKNFPIRIRVRIYLKHEIQRLAKTLFNLMRDSLVVISRNNSSNIVTKQQLIKSENLARLRGVIDYIGRRFGQYK